MGETVMKLMPVDSRDGSVDTEGLSGEHVEKRWVETKEFRGQTYIVEDDELTLPSDEKGDAKVDANGVLLGGPSLPPLYCTVPGKALIKLL